MQNQLLRTLLLQILLRQKIFLPIGPNACWKTDAGGFSELSVTPVTTTPSTAKTIRCMTPVVKIPATADRFTKGRYDLPFIQNLEFYVHLQK